jgi:hypothetical protein
MTYKILILAPSSNSNSLGRAISMAIVAREIGQVWLTAYNDGPIWGPANQFDVEVTTLGPDVSRDSTLQSWMAADGVPVLWVCKGLAPLNRIVLQLQNLVAGLITILDLDDDDSGLAEMYRARRMRNRVTLNAFRRMHPRNIKKSQREISAMADGFTFSTDALREGRYPSLHPFTRVPHVRRPAFQTPRKWRGPVLKVGAFGTMRAHKGGETIRRLLDADADVHIYCFSGSGLEISGGSASRVHLVQPTTSLSEAYEKVDVALIPLELENRGARLQLPAKLVDAMSFGVPIVATRSPAIEEILGSSGNLIDSVDDIERLSANLRTAARRDTSAMTAIFQSILTPNAAATQLDNLIRSITTKRP